MNKSILKHEMRSMKWMALLSIIASLFLVTMFSLVLDGDYQRMFSQGINGNQALIKSALMDISQIGLVIFTILSIVQVFMQFRSEKDQEIARFLKSLPVKKEEFFKIKLISGIINLSLAFIVFAIGIIIVRSNNMFWIKDIYNVSIISQPFIHSDGVLSLMKYLGLVYFIIINVYTFLFMIQYTFSNVVGAIVTGVLVYLAPIFIISASVFTFGKLTYMVSFRRAWVYGLDKFVTWLLPWIYAFEYNNIIVDPNGIGLARIDIIENLGIKYAIIIVLIIINILIAYKFNKSSRVENENMVIPFKASRNIFKIGVTVCSGLLLSTIIGEIMGLQMSSIIYILIIVLGGFIGYFISKQITKVGTR